MNAIHIRRLRFRGQETQRLKVMTDLDRVAWPVLREREYLFVRQLRARQPAATLASSLAEQAQAFGSAAVSGWKEDADGENAVYFASHAELLACLSRDLVRMNRRWFWQEWERLFDQTLETALVDCWVQHPHLIPAMAAHLAKRGELPGFWRHLPEACAERLCHVVCPPPKLARLLESPAADRVADVHIPAQWLAPWESVFSGAALSEPAKALAALIVVREWQPLKWLQDDVKPVFDALLFRFSTPSGPDPLACRRAPDAAAAGGEAPVPGVFSAVMASAERVAPPVPDTKGGYPVVTGETEPLAAPSLTQARGQPAKQGVRPAMDNAMTMAKEEQPGIPSSVAGPEQAKTLPQRVRYVVQPEFATGVDTGVRVGQGGVFYLLNFLNLPHVQQSLVSDPVSKAYPSAWGWLFRLADTMGLEAEPSMLRLFAFLCGCDRPEELNQLPPLPQTHELLLWGRQRYGDALFSAALFGADARVECDVGHVDIFYPLDSIRLEVRRAGLDIDPGWLPWLGKVVKFHYGP